jgi:deoxyribonuclease-4
MKIGAKIGPTEDNWGTLQKLAKSMDFIEAYYTKERTELSRLLSLDTRWVVHGPHSGHGFNTVDGSNMKFFEDSIVLAYELGAKYVILHPGHYREGNRKVLFNRMIENMKKLKSLCKKNKVGILIENIIPFLHMGPDIPIISEKDEGFGFAPEEVKKILKELRCEFVLDFSHAYISSLHLNVDYKEFIGEFMKLRPVMFHICDGNLGKKKDMHLPLGKGNYDLPFFISVIDRDVTLEIKPPTLENFAESKKYIERILKA